MRCIALFVLVIGCVGQTEPSPLGVDGSRVRANSHVMATCPDYLIVRGSDGALWLTPPAEYDGGGTIVARKLPSGEIGFYVGPGPRTDLASFVAKPPPKLTPPPTEPGDTPLQRMFDPPAAAP